MKQVALFLLLSLSLFSNAKDAPKYVLSTVAPDMRENVNAMVWADKSSFVIVNRAKSIHKVFGAVSIMNVNAKDLAMVVVQYDKNSKITVIRGSVYDANGTLVRKIKPTEIYDQSASEGSTLFSDNRLKAMNLTHTSYPYTIEYEYEVEYKALFYVPSFSLYPDEKVSVLEAELNYVYPKDLKPRFRNHLLTEKPEVSSAGDNLESSVWKFSNLKPIRFEPYGPMNVPSIIASPTVFEYDGYSGNMESWDKIGEWIHQLNKGRNVLPPATLEKITNLTKDLKTPEEKIKVLYEYMQNKTRYVSIQLGIGGYQPFEASVVDQNGYGDCKALSNYMVSMLDHVGIKSNYVLVYAGARRRKLQTDFPSLQFNHAVVCVPLAKDTIWLECTSQTVPFGYMGYHTGNRQALAVTETGAKVVNTPYYSEKDNVQRRTATVNVDEAGNATASVKTTYSGLQYENGSLDAVITDTYDNQKKWIEHSTYIPSFDISSFTFKNIKERIPSAVLNLELRLNRYATVNGKRLFLTPNIMNKSTLIPEKVENRKTNVIREYAYTDYDTINFNVSEKIYAEFLPEPVKISSRFGEYEASFKLDQGKVVYTRKMVMKDGVFPPESYQEMIDFYKAVNKADNVKIVFLTKT